MTHSANNNISQIWKSARRKRQEEDPSQNKSKGPEETPLQVLCGRCESTPRQYEGDKNGLSTCSTSSDFFDLETGRVIQLRLVKAIIEKLTPIRKHGGTLERYQSKSGLWVEMSDGEVGREIINFLQDSATTHLLSAVTRMLHIKAGCERELYETAPSKINLGNGVLCTESLKLVKFCSKYNHRNKLPFDYDPEAESPTWHKMLESTFKGDKDQIRLIKNIFGYCLTPHNHFQHFFLFLGRGANGKSVILNILSAMLGRENICSLPLDNLGHNFMLAGLYGKQANIVTEVDTSRAMRSSMLKALVGDDYITADRKYLSPVMFKPSAKHIFAVNEMPRFSDASHGLSRRAVIVIFDRTFKPEEQDPKLTEKLERELARIFNWSLEGLREIRKNSSLYIPEASLKMKQRFLEAQNPVLLFVKEECHRIKSGLIKRTDLYKSYMFWVGDAGISKFRMSRQRFYDQLRADCPEFTEKRTGGEDYFVGISISTRTQNMLRSIAEELREKGKDES